MSAEILVVRCGTVPYEEAREAQRRLEERRQREEIPDVLLLLEHTAVYSRGRRSTPEELPMGNEWYEMQGIEVRDTDRGGRVTYHGPGQLVAYPIVSLAPYGDDVHEYVRRLEQVMIGALAEHGVEAGVIDGLTGVWTQTPGRRAENPRISGEIGPSTPGRRADNGTMAPEIGPSTAGPPTPGDSRKIGSIGVHVSRGVTTHGLAINVNNDLQPFEWIVPCGIEGVAMTSLSRELGSEQDLEAFADTIVARFADVYERSPIPTDPADLGLDLPPATLGPPR